MEDINKRLDRIERMIAEISEISKNILDTKEVAAMLKISESRVSHLCAEHKIPYYKAEGRKARSFRREDIENYMLGTRHASNDELKAEAAKRYAR